MSVDGPSGTVPLRYKFDLLQKADFYQHAGLLHPLAVGLLGICFTFVYLRLASNRAAAPLTIFDSIVNVALGGVLAGLLNGNNLAQGTIGLVSILGFQKLASYIGSKAHWRVSRVFSKPGLIVIFRGKALTELMESHKISQRDLNQALRAEKIWNICEVEACVIEPTGVFTVYKRCDYPQDIKPEVLLAVDGYQALCELFDQDEGQKEKCQRSDGGEVGILEARRNSSSTQVVAHVSVTMQPVDSHHMNQVADECS